MALSSAWRHGSERVGELYIVSAICLIPALVLTQAAGPSQDLPIFDAGIEALPRRGAPSAELREFPCRCPSAVTSSRSDGSLSPQFATRVRSEASTIDRNREARPWEG